MTTIKLEDDKNCFACGDKNKYGLHLKFTIDKDKERQDAFDKSLYIE